MRVHRLYPDDPIGESVWATGAIARKRLQIPAGEVKGMSAVAVIWIGVATICCGLCIYGINRAIRRSKERREERTPALTKP